MDERDYLPKWAYYVAVAFCVWFLANKFRNRPGEIVIYSIANLGLAFILYLFRKRIALKRQNAYYFRNIIFGISLCFGFLTLANRNSMTRY